uniref:Uncharacterized protein n=1 Tax=Colobus angolensis palliatus TaxID=336983 RepID=A0A2K5HWP6_COLAP
MPRWFVQQPTSCPHAQPLQPPHRTAGLGPLVPSCGSAAWPSLHYLGSPADSGCSRGQRPPSCCSQCPQGRPPHPVPRSQRRGSRDLGKEQGEEPPGLRPCDRLHLHPMSRTPLSASAGCDPSLTQPSPHPTPLRQGCVTPFHR